MYPPNTHYFLSKHQPKLFSLSIWLLLKRYHHSLLRHDHLCRPETDNVEQMTTTGRVCHDQCWHDTLDDAHDMERSVRRVFRLLYTDR